MDSLVKETDRAIDGVRLCVECLRTQAGKEVPWAWECRLDGPVPSPPTSQSAWWWRSAPSTTR